MKDFFISYNKADRQWAEWIAWQLEETGFTTVIQAWDFRPGSNFVLDMHQAAATAERTIAVLSPDYLQSLYTQSEWAAAFAQDPTSAQKKLLPVRVRECRLEGLLAQIVYIDLTSADADSAKEALLAGIKRERAKPTASPGFPGPAHHAVSTQPSFPGSIHIPSRTVDELIAAYSQHLEQRVGTVRLFGEERSHPLDQVFVELTINEDYDRRPNQAEFLGLMDAELRKMRSVFGDAEERREQNRDGDGAARSTKPKRTVKPDELLRRHTHAVITGAPGCGKTTLLRYLAWQTLKAFVVPPSGGRVRNQAIPPEGGTTNARLPVFLELKQLTAADFAQAQLEDLLFHKAIAAAVKPRDEAECDALRQYFLDRLRAGRVAIFLDGLDEVSGASFFKDLQTAVQTFLQSAYGGNTVILSTRPFALRQFGDAKMMEIQPLSPRQIEQFIEHYYRDVPERQQFQRELQRRRELRELARVPALLGFILQLWRKRGSVTDDKLELYAQITLELAQQLDREKEGIAPEREWLVEDKDGSLKLDLLRQLAFNQLFKGLIHPPYEVGGGSNDVDRLVFNSEQLLDETERFAASLYQRVGRTIDHYALVKDVKATALLREVGYNHYAFAHLTLQEYLAAWQLAKGDNADTCERIFCRVYFNPTLAEMEVLPMTLGLVDEPDKLYEGLEQLPESLDFKGLRLQARGLGYVKNIQRKKLDKLADRLVEFVTEQQSEDTAYLDVVGRAFSCPVHEALELIVNVLAMLLNSKVHPVKCHAVELLRQIGNDHAAEALVMALQDQSEVVVERALSALGQVGDEQAVKALIPALKSWGLGVQKAAASALGQIGGEQAVKTLISVSQSQDWDIQDVQGAIFSALGQIGNQEAVAFLIEAVKGKPSGERNRAVEGLGKIRTPQAIAAIVELLQEKEEPPSDATHEPPKQTGRIRVVSFDCYEHSQWLNSIARESAVIVLSEIGSEQAVDALIGALQDEKSNVRVRAASALGSVGDERAVTALLTALQDEDGCVRATAATTLGRIGDEKAIAGLITVLQHKYEYEYDRNDELRLSDADWHDHIRLGTRNCAAEALGEIRSPLAVGALIVALSDTNGIVRESAARALGQIGSEQAVEALILALQDEEYEVQQAACTALGQISGNRAVEALIVALPNKIDAYWDVAFALRQIGGEREVEALISLLEDDPQQLGFPVAYALGRIGNERSVAALQNVLRSQDKEKRWNAALALGEKGGKQAVAALIEVVHVVDSGIRMPAIKELARIGGETAVKEFLKILQEDFYVFRSWAAEALGQIAEQEFTGREQVFTHGLLGAMKCNNSFVRRKAASIISYYAKDEMVNRELSRLLAKDRSPKVRTVAREAIQMFERKLQYFDIHIPTTVTKDPSPPSPPPPLTAQEHAELETRIAAKYQEVLRGSDVRQKGKALEELLAAVFASIPGFSVSERNYHTTTEELDLVLRNASADPFWRGMGSLVLVEAKHWQSQRVGKNEYVQFYRKLENRGGHCTLGFLICTERFAETFHQESLRDSQRRLRVVPIDGEDLRRLVEMEDRAAVLREFVERAVLR